MEYHTFEYYRAKLKQYVAKRENFPRQNVTYWFYPSDEEGSWPTVNEVEGLSLIDVDVADLCNITLQRRRRDLVNDFWRDRPVNKDVPLNFRDTVNELGLAASSYSWHRDSDTPSLYDELKADRAASFIRQFNSASQLASSGPKSDTFWRWILELNSKGNLFSAIPKATEWRRPDSPFPAREMTAKEYRQWKKKTHSALDSLIKLIQQSHTNHYFGILGGVAIRDFLNERGHDDPDYESWRATMPNLKAESRYPAPENAVPGFEWPDILLSDLLIDYADFLKRYHERPFIDSPASKYAKYRLFTIKLCNASAIEAADAGFVLELLQVYFDDLPAIDVTTVRDWIKEGQEKFAP